MKAFLTTDRETAALKALACFSDFALTRQVYDKMPTEYQTATVHPVKDSLNRLTDKGLATKMKISDAKAAYRITEAGENVLKNGTAKPRVLTQAEIEALENSDDFLTIPTELNFDELDYKIHQSDDFDNLTIGNLV